jgi:hypothetical protein
MSEILKITKEQNDLYIPKKYISSFSVTGGSITINFTKEIKITGFKKSDKITFKTDVEKIKKEILKNY